MVARTMHPALSSKTSEGFSLVLRFVSNKLVLVCDCSASVRSLEETKVLLYISLSNCRSGSKVRIKVLSAINSASVVLKAISVCSLLDQMTGQPQYVMT